MKNEEVEKVNVDEEDDDDGEDGDDGDDDDDDDDEEQQQQQVYRLFFINSNIDLRHLQSLSLVPAPASTLLPSGQAVHCAAVFPAALYVFSGQN